MTSRLLTLILVLFFLAACGVAVEQNSLPQTSAPDTILKTETAAAPQPAETGNADANVTTGADEGVDMASLAPSVTGNIDGLIEVIEEEAEVKEKADEDTVAQPSAQTGIPGSETVAKDEAPVSSNETQSVAEPVSDKTTLDEGSAAATVGNIIWNLEAANRGRVAPEPEPVVPVGPDPSLATEALEAAFAMLARRDQGFETGGFIMPPKSVGIMRIALLVPKSGKNAVLGNELQRGAELALFSLRNSQIELLVFDTVEKGAGVAAREAVIAEADIIVGPLFSDAVVSARQVSATHSVPMLALSNNTAIAGRGSWLFGYLPEQQVDILLGHALTAGRNKVGIIAADDVFGQRLARHAQKRLGQFGLEPEDFITLTAAQLASEDELKNAVKRFTGYIPPANDEDTPAASELPPPRFDAVLFAGSAEFALRTAPVLAYYDADPERVMYLGNAQWNQRRILMEPSLQGGLFASRPTDRDNVFNTLWSEALGGRPGVLARLSFDAMAMAMILAGQKRETWNALLEAGSGYNGFSGAYRLMPDGGNRRNFEIRQISGGVSTIFQPAPDKI